MENKSFGDYCNGYGLCEGDCGSGSCRGSCSNDTTFSPKSLKCVMCGSPIKKEWFDCPYCGADFRKEY